MEINSVTHTNTQMGFEKGRRLGCCCSRWGGAEETRERKRERREEAKKQKRKIIRKHQVPRFPSLSLSSFSLALSRRRLPSSRPTQARSQNVPLSPPLSLPLLSQSNAGRVQHHPHPGAQRRRREVLCKLGPDGPRAAVRPRDAAPDDAELGAALEGLGLVDVGEALLLLLVLTMFERRWGERVSEFFFSCFEGGSAREREAAAVAAAARSGSIAMGPLFLSSHLAEVELRLALGLDALDLDERRVVVLRALPPVGELGVLEREDFEESTW